MSSGEVKPPRPLWQLKEELEDHLRQRPGPNDLLGRANWNGKKVRLQMWIAYLENKS